MVHPVVGAPRFQPVYRSDHQILRDPRTPTLYVREIIRVGELRFVALRRRTD